MLLALVRGIPPVTGGFPSQRASNAENVSIWWRSSSYKYCTQNYASEPQTVLFVHMPNIDHSMRPLKNIIYNAFYEQFVKLFCVVITPVLVLFSAIQSSGADTNGVSIDKADFTNIQFWGKARLKWCVHIIVIFISESAVYPTRAIPRMSMCWRRKEPGY